jgi:hypothetical protein
LTANFSTSAVCVAALCCFLSCVLTIFSMRAFTQCGGPLQVVLRPCTSRFRSSSLYPSCQQSHHQKQNRLPTLKVASCILTNNSVYRERGWAIGSWEVRR